MWSPICNLSLVSLSILSLELLGINILPKACTEWLYLIQIWSSHLCITVVETLICVFAEVSHTQPAKALSAMPRSQKGLYALNSKFTWESYQKRGMQIAADAKLKRIISRSLQFKQQNNPGHTQDLFTSQGSTIHKQIVLHLFHQLLNQLQAFTLKGLLNIPDYSSDQS